MGINTYREKRETNCVQIDIEKTDRQSHLQRSLPPENLVKTTLWKLNGWMADSEASNLSHLRLDVTTTYV